MKTVFNIFSFTLIALLICAVFPYPAFSRYTNITQIEAYKINNFHESEITNQASQKTEILDLKFESLDLIFPINSQFEIFDMHSSSSFMATRTGGKNHFDIEPVDFENAQIIQQIAAENNSAESQIWSWTRHPVIVKLNEHAFLPASIAYYPHGHTKNPVITNGHFCLHFAGSKTDGTNMVDDFHQKCVAYAKRNGKNFLKNI